ncbi:winged helix-turn-helix domain-containing protein [Candidatus Tisiphia endosymbiont of Neophilaenus lineatus]|uniref:winged helix-turn-helix domain-containing protein n=1 Tax=Candidatus Tisiphia endosymbiont of Neophilaenus lineatus TaxID=3139336 RepID=UPI0035C99CF6
MQLVLVEEYGAKCALKTVYNTMHHLGFSWITSRSMHPKSNQETQNRYKKTFQTC